jgi:hypothetical protein
MVRDLVCAGGKGFEPLQTDPESAVLPLDEPPLFTGEFYHSSSGLSRFRFFARSYLEFWSAKFSNKITA